MATADQIIEIALREVGYIETPNNRTKYGRWYGLDGNPWCDMFISWVFNEAGALAICHGKNAYTPSHAQRFKNAGQWGGAPRKGAVVFFNFGGNRIHHVGLQITDAGVPIDTVEGNTSRGASGSQRDGGGVWRRRRASGIVGYGYPAYDRPGSPPTQGDDRYRPWPGNPSQRYGGYNRIEFEKRKDGNVVWIQARLNATNLQPKLAADGFFGQKTDQAVKGFQGAVGLRQDGIVGPATWERLKGR